MFPSTTANKNISNRCVANSNSGAGVAPNDVESQWKGVLRRYDANGDGRLSRKELEAAFKSRGSSVPWWRAIRALHRGDKNGDGFIDEAEFPSVAKYAAKKGYVL